jgi:ABC-type methionine transport system permease subunit
MLWVVTVGLGLYSNLNYSSINPEDINIDTSKSEEEQMKEKQNALLWELTGQTIFMAVVAIMAGAVIGSILKLEDSYQAYVYGAITSIFWTSYIRSIAVFWNISNSIPGGIIILILITAIVAYVFLVGLFQMVTGGWKGYV